MVMQTLAGKCCMKLYTICMSEESLDLGVFSIYTSSASHQNLSNSSSWTFSVETCQNLFEIFNAQYSGSLLSTCCWHFHKTLTYQWAQTPLFTSPAASFAQKTLFTSGIREFTPHYRHSHLTRSGQPSQPAVSRVPSRNFVATGVMLAVSQASITEDVWSSLHALVSSSAISHMSSLRAPRRTPSVWVTYEHSFSTWSDASCVFTLKSSSSSDLFNTK